MHMALTSFNSSASYYRSLQSYDRHGALHFDYKDYKIPRSSFQKAVNDSKVLPPAIAKTLNEQGEVIFNILKEMDELSASIEVEVNEKRYEKDHLDKIYSHLERQRVLMETWDSKKEEMYIDVRTVFDTYPPGAVQNSWFVSGTALETLTDLDRAGLFLAKNYYKGDSTITVPTDKIETKFRDVIAKEYENMKGIEKYGRSNGLCPYTPYEDLPQTSKSLAEKLKNLKPVKSTTSRHPYEELVYHYNDIVRDYNKFCELSKDVLLLQTVYQPEIFTVKYPEKKKEEVAQNISRTESKPVKSNPVSASDPQVNERPRHTSDVIHDTVYIEKRDTIYLAESGEDVRSMEGYATNNLVLLLDVSGSMNVPEKLPVLKQSVLNMLSMMRQEDEVAIVVFSGKAKILLSPLSFKEEDKIKKAVNNLTSSGKTDGNAGIKLAYKTADENYIRGGNNRIILATDGEFPVGDETKKLVEKFAAQDIFLTIFNFGKSTASSKNLETLATLGKGNYEYISRENVDLKLIREAKGKKKK
jgi:Ca-activated chloride channel homolog